MANGDKALPDTPISGAAAALTDASVADAGKALPVVGGASPDAGGAPIPGQSRVLPPVDAPVPILYPSVRNMPGPDKHPQIVQECLTGAFYGDPPTRGGQSTSGSILAPAEAAAKKAMIELALVFAAPQRPLSATNLRHWLDGSGTPLVMPSAPFQNVDSEVPTFLASTARDAFEKGITARLKDRKHPQGTLLPAKLDPGNKGPVRFLQYESGPPSPSATKGGIATDLFTAVGSFNVHSVMWAQAAYVKSEGGVFGIGSDDVFDIDILKWCVQIYDVYDWNFSKAKPPFTPFPLDDAQFATFLQKVKLPMDGVRVQKLFSNINVVFVADSLMRDLEVSGIGRAYLIRSEVFEAPGSVRGKFTIKV